MKRRLFLKLGALLGITGSSRDSVPHHFSGTPHVLRKMSDGGYIAKVFFPWLPSRLVVSFRDVKGNLLHERIYGKPSVDCKHVDIPHVGGSYPVTFYHCWTTRTKNGYEGRSVEYTYSAGVYYVQLCIERGEYVTWEADELRRNSS